MKKIKLNAYQVGLVFRNGGYQKMLLAGTYWFWKNEQVYVYDIAKQFLPPVELNILLQDERLADILQVIEVMDNEIALQYENGLLKQVMTPGRYVFWKSLVKQEFIKADISKIDIAASIDRSLLSKAPLNTWVRMSEVQNYEKALLFVENKYVKLLEP
ncbi:MAG: slipin family protein, partial [Bacteroidota bacterium]